MPAWISIEGVDGVGKTTLCRGLARVRPDWTFIPEFGDSTLGSFLAKQVTRAPHFIAHSELAQSLLFLAEYVDRIDTMIRPALARDEVVVTDRGNRSKYVYQLLVLRRRYSLETSKGLLDAVFRELPRPSHVAILTAPLPEVERRISHTRHSMNDDERRFIESAAELFAATDTTGAVTVFIDTAENDAEATLRTLLRRLAPGSAAGLV